MRKNSPAGYAIAILSGFCYGFIPLVVLSVSRSGVATGSCCSMYRMLFSGILLLPAAIRSIKKNGFFGQVKKRLFSGFVYAAITVFLYSAFDVLPSGVAMALHYTYPVFSLLFAWLLYKSRPGKTVAPAALLSVVGVVILCDLSALPPHPGMGILLAVLSAASCAGYYAYVEKTGLGECPVTEYVCFNNILSGVFMFLYNTAAGTFTTGFSGRQWLLLLLASVIMIGATVTQVLGIRLVGAVKSTVLCTLEPIICTIGSALLLKDALTWRIGLGAVLVLAAVVWLTLASAKENKDAAAAPSAAPEER